MAFFRLSALFCLIVALFFPAPAYSTDLRPDIVRGLFCTDIAGREPVDQLQAATPDLRTVYFFTEIANAGGQTLLHRWLHNGWTIAEVPLPIGAPRWRTWSSKKIWHLGKGRLAVQVVNGEGEVLLEQAIPVTIENSVGEPSEPESARETR